MKQTELQNLLRDFLDDNPESEEQLDKELDVSIQTIRRWKNGETASHPDITKRIVAYLKNKTQTG